jgi:hypothetical protein
MGDRDRLAAALADYLAVFGQRRWHINERYWERSKLAFIHATRGTRSSSTHEAMVMARIVNGRLRIRRYVLLWNEEEWLTCDQGAFEEFLADGPRGLRRGNFRIKKTICSCRQMVHRSEARARRHARDLAHRYGKSGVQRSYRCSENPRAFHLTAQEKGSRELMLDAYIEPGTPKQ